MLFAVLNADQPLDLDEENVMLFQFNTLADMQLYFYILCFEETGQLWLACYVQLL